MSGAVGIDGCPGGWIAVCLRANEFHVELVSDLRSFLTSRKRSDLVLIDMPIGFPDSQPRPCETEARALLGWPRSSSVFSVPVREVITDARTYTAASNIQRAKIDRGLTKQCWNLVPKMKALDTILRDANHACRIRESHPEVVFGALNQGRFDTTARGFGLVASKKKSVGREQRLAILEQYQKNARKIYAHAESSYRRKDLARDDIVDALGLAIAAQLIQRKRATLLTLPPNPPRDSHGLAMEIVYVKPQ